MSGTFSVTYVIESLNISWGSHARRNVPNSERTQLALTLAQLTRGCKTIVRGGRRCSHSCIPTGEFLSLGRVCEGEHRRVRGEDAVWSSSRNWHSTHGQTFVTGMRRGFTYIEKLSCQWRPRKEISSSQNNGRECRSLWRQTEVLQT